MLLIYKNFKRGAKENKNAMTEDEWVTCLAGKGFSQGILKAIDKIYIPTEEQYLNASESTGNLYYSEKDMLQTFLQTDLKTQKAKHRMKERLAKHKANSLTAKKKKKDDEAFDEEKQRHVYRIFEFKGKNYLTFEYFLRFFQTSWYFMNVDSDLNGVVSYIELRDSIKYYDPPIEFSPIEK